MFTRKVLFALAAAVTLGLAALASSTDASARPHGGGMGHHGGGGKGMGHGGHHGGRHGHHGGRHGHGHNHRRHVHRHGCFWRHGSHGGRHCHWHPRRIILVRSVAATPIYPVVRSVAAPGPCTCLTKTYLPNGAVLFRDVCTNEAAVNPPQQAAESPAVPE